MASGSRGACHGRMAEHSYRSHKRTDMGLINLPAYSSAAVKQKFRYRPAAVQPGSMGLQEVTCTTHKEGFRCIDIIAETDERWKDGKPICAGEVGREIMLDSSLVLHELKPHVKQLLYDEVKWILQLT